MSKRNPNRRFHPTREKIHEIIFEADTPKGKLFDVVLLVMILASVVVVMLETVPTLADEYLQLFLILEWIFTIFFTVEYILRLYCVYKPIKYAVSFFGIVDLLSILPTYLSLFFFGTNHLATIRALRLLRVFRIFKMMGFVSEGAYIMNSLKNSRYKITVFLFAVLMLVIIAGTLMHLIEGGQNEQFDSIPRSIYWAIVTLTTVGYGDISPITTLGQFVASMIMIMGYAIIAVPTGIVTADMATQSMKSKIQPQSTQACRFCSKEGHDLNAEYCKYCGEELNDPDHTDQSGNLK